jgi:o-succinylbenzoate---CoA ligase
LSLSTERNIPTEMLRAQIYALFCRRLQSGWFSDEKGQMTLDLADRKLAEFTRSPPNFISIATRNPIEFIALLIAGLRLGIPIFLGDSQWGIKEWAQVNILTARVDRELHRDWIMIPTGGSSGDIKFAIHTWETLSASVWGFQEFYGVTEINAVCVLPLYHVSGLMQLFRSLLTNGKLLVIDYQQLWQDPDLCLQNIEIDRYFISLVPTQLHKLIGLIPDRLAEFKTILLGGAPPHPELLDRSRIARLPLALTYGMTETASQITSLKPSEFLAGDCSCGSILPHAEILCLDDGIGAVRIKAKSLMLGYFPQIEIGKCLETDDLGSIDDRGHLTILGRSSDKIITGGENVLPIEIVDVIMATELVADIWVVGLPDPYWGQIVTAVYVAGSLLVSEQQLVDAIAGKVSNYKIPKYWLKVAQIPRNSLGKILIREVELLARSKINSIESAN